MKIVYAEPIRMPTESAHGLQVAKMCEALGRAGHQVELWHARRRQPDPALAATTPFDYYGVERTFAVEALPFLDVARAGKAVPSGAGPTLQTVATRRWAASVARRARTAAPSLWITRTPDVAWALVRVGQPVAMELHLVPRRSGRDRLRKLGAARTFLRCATTTAAMVPEVEEAGIDPARIVVLHDAVDPAPFERLPSRHEARGLLGLPPDVPVVSYVGRFRAMDREKGIITLIRALASVGQGDGSPPMLVAVGGPMDAVAGYEAMAADVGVAADRFRFVDRVPPTEVPTWIAAADVVVLPSPDEPFFARYSSPLKLFEYLAAGAAIIASDLPAIREVLTDGVDGRLVTAGDPTALAAAIRELLADDDLRVELGAAARVRARDFTWTARAEALVEGLP